MIQQINLLNAVIFLCICKSISNNERNQHSRGLSPEPPWPRIIDYLPASTVQWW